MKECLGYIDHANGVVYTNYNTKLEIMSQWKATDLESGLRIASQNDFEDLQRRVNELNPSLQTEKKSIRYGKLRNIFNQLLKKSGKNIPIPNHNKYLVNRKSDGNILLQISVSSEEELKDILGKLESAY